MTAEMDAVSHGPKIPLVTPAVVIAEARTWLDVPVFHRGRTRAGGVDCLGLVICVGVAAGAVDAPDDPELEDYGRLPNPKRLVAGLDRRLVPIDKAEAGPADVLAFSWGLDGAPMHLAIMAEHRGRATIIHAFPLIVPQRVVEMSFAADWPPRLCAAWRYPRVTV